MKHEATNRPKCKISGCGKNAVSLNLCCKHYNRFRSHGDANAYSAYDPNEFIDNGDGSYSIILKDKKGNPVAAAIIDSESLTDVIGHKWGLSTNGYATTGKKPLHRFLIPDKKGHYTDHIDRDKMNNRMSNLRTVTPTESAINIGLKAHNTSGFIGVSFNSYRKKWEAYIKVNGKQKHLGIFNDANAAIVTRLKAEAHHFGEFAPQKHIMSEYGIHNDAI